MFIQADVQLKKDGRGSPFSLCLTVVSSWVSPRHCQSLFQVLLGFGAARCSGQQGDVGEKFAVPVTWESKMGLEEVSLAHSE